MTTRNFQSAEMRRQVGSPKPKGRDTKDTLCRNVLIYGHCRYEDQGCAFNHDQNKTLNNATNNDITPKKTLNVASPSFTPASAQSAAPKKPTFSSQSLSAAPFTPRGASLATSPTSVKAEADNTPSFNPATVREFTPSNNYDLSTAGTNPSTSVTEGQLNYDAFSMAGVGHALAATPYNMYDEDHGALASASNAYFQVHNPYSALVQPLQYHLYASIGPYRDELQPYQRLTHDFFMSESLREDFQKRAEAAHQVIPNSQLPHLENFHSLVPLDTTNRRNTNQLFGFPTWLYKAISIKTGHFRCLRRVEGYRLSNENAMKPVREWRKVDCSNVVKIFDAFTCRSFGDSSLVFVQDYHPLSKTLMEVHFPASTSQISRYNKNQVTEQIIWSYIAQIANALRAIHSANLAARCIDLGKILLTDKNRIRLGACSILDVLQFEPQKPVAELQQEDFVQFGKCILSLATDTPPSQLSNAAAAMEQLGRTYSPELRDTITWLLTPQSPEGHKSIGEFVRGISSQIVSSLDSAFHASDVLNSELYKTLESDRLARLLMKLGCIMERGEHDGDPQWSEHGERYMVKLFRDYVFHQVDANGNPVVDPGHIIRCLNKFDVGTDERICLTSRDDQTVFIVSYKELKRQFQSAFNDLFKNSKNQRPL